MGAIIEAEKSVPRGRWTVWESKDYSKVIDEQPWKSRGNGEVGNPDIGKMGISEFQFSEWWMFKSINVVWGVVGCG